MKEPTQNRVEDNTLRRMTAAFAIPFLFMLLVAVVVGVMSSKIRTVSQDMIAGKMAKLVLIDRISRDISTLHLNALQNIVSEDAADAAAQLVAIEHKIEVNTGHLQELRTMLEDPAEFALFDRAIELREIIIPQLMGMMKGSRHAGIAERVRLYGPELRNQTNQFLATLFELSEDIGSHTKEKMEIVMGWIKLTRYLVFSLVLLAVCIGAFQLRNLYLVAAHLRKDKRLLAEEVEHNRIAALKISQLENALDNADEIIIMFDSCRRLIYANHGARSKLGYTAAEIAEVDPLALHKPAEGIDSEGLLASLRDGSSPSVRMETHYQRKDGSAFPAELMLQYVVEGETGVFVTIARDITERKEVERLKNEFVSVVSHELRTPLTSIRGALGILASGKAGELDHDAQGMVAIAATNCDRLVRLIGDILDLEKIEAGKMEFHLVPRDLRELVNEAIEVNLNFAGRFDVALTARAGEHPAYSRVDADRIIQLLTNLISNAVKYSPAGGAVEVGIEPRLGNWRVMVADHGEGIPESFRHQVFSKFAQAERTSTRKKGGTGLGLSIVKMIAENHGGTAGFTTEVGRGTTFFVDIPRHETAENRVAPMRTPMKLLVCESDVQAAESLSLAMAKAGFQAVIASTPEHAVRLAAEMQFDALAIDLSLPYKEAIGLLHQIGSDGMNALLPVVVVATRETPIQILSQPVRILDWQKKPIDTERLKSALQPENENRAAVKILHIEDDAGVRQVISAVLSNIGRVTPAVSAVEAVHEMSREQYDVIVLDLDLGAGPHAGIELLETIRAKQGDVAVVIFSAHEVGRKLAGQVQGVLLKARTSNAEFTAMVEQVLPRLPG